MANVINNLKSTLGSGMRTSKYQIILNLPNNLLNLVSITELNTLCKSSSFPSKTVGTTEAWIYGKKVLLKGDTEFEQSWQVTFYESENHSLRNLFSKWINDIDNYETAIHNESIETNLSSKINQLDGKGNVAASYEFYNFWPTSIDTTEVAMENINTIGEITVTFAFDYWKKI